MGKTVRSVARVLPFSRPHWVGDGFNVLPVFAAEAFSAEISPWLMFDYAAPKNFPKTSKRLGVGQHPHRGFETVTIAFQGEVEHADSVGNHGVIGAGDVQWMTAARGIIHEEFHSRKFAAEGGTFEMCQLWVNLPAKHKMDPPRYQEILAASIPTVSLAAAGPSCEAGGGGRLRVIAGEYAGAAGAARTFTPVELWDVALPAPATYELAMPDGHTVAVFVRRGSITIGPEGSESKVGTQGVALLDRRGTTIRLTAGDGGASLLVLGGEPIDEPIAARGPFVMNTRDELMQAMDDFHSGRLGR